jgi:hypothetical protein
VIFTGPDIIAGIVDIRVVQIMLLDAVTGEDVHAPMAIALGWHLVIRHGDFPASFMMIVGKNKRAMKKGGTRLTGPAFLWLNHIDSRGLVHYDQNMVVMPELSG